MAELVLGINLLFFARNTKRTREEGVRSITRGVFITLSGSAMAEAVPTIIAIINFRIYPARLGSLPYGGYSFRSTTQ